MENSLKSAFITALPRKTNERQSLVCLSQKPGDAKQKKKKMEEIQLMKKKAVIYLEQLAGYDTRYIDKALQNLSLNGEALRLNLTQLNADMNIFEIQKHYNYLFQALSKLNSIGKEIKKINKCKIRKNTINNHSPLNEELSYNKSSFNQGNLQLKSKTMDEKRMSHIKLLYKQSIQAELKRRQKQHWNSSIDERVKENLKNNFQKKQAEKNKKLQDKLLRKNIDEEQQNDMPESKHQETKQMIKTNQSSFNKTPKKIIDYKQKVAINRQKIQRQLQTYLDKLSCHLKQKFTNSRSHKSMNVIERQSVSNQVKRRRDYIQKQRNANFLRACIEKSIYIESIGASPPKKNIKKEDVSQVEQMDFEEQELEIKPKKFTIVKLKKRHLSERCFKKNKILQDITQNLHKRNTFDRLRFEKNRFERQTQQQSKIMNLNTTYQRSYEKIRTQNQNRNKKQQQHIYNSFKVRKQQQLLHDKLNKIMYQTQKQLKKQLQSITTENSDIFC